MSEIFSRQTMMFSPTTLSQPVHIIWTGFVGSNLFLNLVRTGFQQFVLVDFDTVKEHNLLNQFYTEKDLGNKKVQALIENVRNQNPQELQETQSFIWFSKEYKEFKNFLLQTPGKDEGILVVAVDSLEARIEILDYIIDNWETEKETKNKLIVFVNTSNEILYIGVFKNQLKVLKNMRFTYKKLLETPEASTDGICGEKSSFYLWSLISGFVVGEIRKTYKNQKEEVSQEFIFDVKQNRIRDKARWFTKN